MFFLRAEDAFQYLTTSGMQPFLILSDINLPGISGMRLKEMINADPILRVKSIPFIFFTTSADPYTINRAYHELVQGYFIKPAKANVMADQLRLIIEYWSVCVHPNSAG